MTSTTFYASEASRDGQLTQSWTIGGRRIPYWFAEESVPLNAGAGGVISSVLDMVCSPRFSHNSEFLTQIKSANIRVSLFSRCAG